MVRAARPCGFRADVYAEDMLRSRTFWEIFAAFGALLVLSIGLVGLIVASRSEQAELRHVEERLLAKATYVTGLLSAADMGDEKRLCQRLAVSRDARITLIAADGRVLADSARDAESLENHGDRSEILAAREHGRGTATRFSASVGQSMMYVALRTADSSVAYVRVALPVGAIREQVTFLRGMIWTTAGMTALLALGLAFWLAQRTTRPLQELTLGARQIAGGGFGHKVYTSQQGEVGQLAATFNEMSARLADQFSQLEEDRQQLRTVLSSMVEGVLAIDTDQQILFANERAGQLLEFGTTNVVGRRLWEVVRHRPIQEAVRSALESGHINGREFNWNELEGKILSLHVASLPGAPPRGAVLVFHDITDLRRLETIRQEFVANVSHELKTPLAVIQACTETLLDGGADDPAARGPFLQRINDQAHRLHRLILDLLTLARIETETEIFDMQVVSLEKAVRACLERHRTLAEGKSQQLIPLPEQGEPIAAWADEEAVAQILDNLVDNALKYTPEGGTVRVGWGLAGGGKTCVRVEDTGIGIPEQDMSRIFERFYRVDKARSRELGGTGLGLSIVKHLVQAMKGTVQARSQLGQGSSFTVMLPAAPGESRNPGMPVDTASRTEP